MTALPDNLNIDDDGYPDEAVLDQIRAADTIGTGARWMVEVNESYLAAKRGDVVVGENIADAAALANEQAR